MGSTNVLTDLTHAVVRSTVNTLNGLVLTRPALVTGDGKNQMYACDVNIGVQSADGRIDQTIKYLYGVPGTRHFNVNDTETIGTILRNVPIAPNNGELRYADVGNAVTLTRTGSSQWQITGFSVELPGTRMRYAVDLGTMQFGPVSNLSVGARALTLGELALYGGGFGLCPFGATGVFIAGELQEISS